MNDYITEVCGDRIGSHVEQDRLARWNGWTSKTEWMDKQDGRDGRARWNGWMSRDEMDGQAKAEWIAEGMDG
jgi:hypothetical protein